MTFEFYFYLPNLAHKLKNTVQTKISNLKIFLLYIMKDKSLKNSENIYFLLNWWIFSGLIQFSIYIKCMRF